MSGRLAAVLATAAVAAAVAAALILVGSPRTARLERLDERRIADIEALARWIERYRMREGALPPDLGTLEPMLPGSVSALDPASQAHYGYERLGGGHFRLCAELALPDKQAIDRHARAPRLAPERALAPVPDPSGRRFCLETSDLPAE